MNITQIIRDLEALPMEGNGASLDEAVQMFLDYLYTRKSNTTQTEGATQ